VIVLAVDNNRANFILRRRADGERQRQREGSGEKGRVFPKFQRHLLFLKFKANEWGNSTVKRRNALILPDAPRKINDFFVKKSIFFKIFAAARPFIARRVGAGCQNRPLRYNENSTRFRPRFARFFPLNERTTL
jgi:hypothetical protein